MPEFTDAHGVAIVYDVHAAEGTPRAIVQLLHGVGEHAGRYRELAGILTAAGFTVYADDHRGHGRTGIRQHGGPERLGRLGAGGLRAATASTKSAISRFSGSSLATDMSPPWMDGIGPSPFTSRYTSSFCAA